MVGCARLRRRKPAVILFAAATILLALSQFAAILDTLPEGLNATYFTTPDWSGTPLRSTLDPIPSTYNLYLAWHGRPPQSCSATWTGWMIVLRDGSYTFATASDHGSSLQVEEQLVVDSGRAHQPGLATGTVRLSRGVHRLLVTYFQTDGPPALELHWARNGAPLEPLPAWLLSARPATTTRFAVSVGIRRLATMTVWPWWVATVWVVAAAIVASLRRTYAGRDSAAAVEWTLLFIGAAVLLFVLPHRITSDGAVRYFALAQLIEWRELPTTMYSLVGPLSSAPLSRQDRCFFELVVRAVQYLRAAWRHLGDVAVAAPGDPAGAVQEVRAAAHCGVDVPLPRPGLLWRSVHRGDGRDRPAGGAVPP